MERKKYAGFEEVLLEEVKLCHLFFALLNEEEAMEQEREEIRLGWERLRTKQADSPLFWVRKQLCLDDFLSFCVLLALGFELDGALRNRLQALAGSPVPTLDLAAALFQRLKNNGCEAGVLALCPYRAALRLLFQAREQEGGLLAFFPLLLRRDLLSYLCSGQFAGERLVVLQGAREGTLAIQRDQLSWLWRAARRMEQERGAYALLQGEPGTGKRTLVLRAAQEKPCIYLDCRALETLQPEEIDDLACEMRLAAALSGGWVCLTHVDARMAWRLERLLTDLPERQPLFMLCDSETGAAPDLPGRAPLRLLVGSLSGGDYRLVCRALGGGYWQKKEEPPFYRLSIGQLCAALEQAKQQAQEPLAFFAQFTQAVWQQSRPLALARPVLRRAALRDLVVEEKTAARLELLCRCIQSVREPSTRHERSSRRGITALFYGPSGTGKTMAASAIADRLGLELLKIDLSQVLDKYIGETEKHLQELFDAAQERNCILFFDEADALFSKRTEISTSHDRYANIETSFLLQSMEAFDGAVILATNLFKNFDEAFLRRIDILLRFSLPNEGQRLALWEKGLSGLLLGEDISLHELAEEEALSPAAIAGITDLARLLCQNGDRLSGAVLRDLLQMEHLKTGK